MVVVIVEVQQKLNSPQIVVLTMCDGFSHSGLAFTAQLWVDGAAEQAGAGPETEADRANRAKGKTTTKHEHNQARKVEDTPQRWSSSSRGKQGVRVGVMLSEATAKSPPHASD